MSEYIEVGQPLQFTDPNTPTRVGEIVKNVSDIYNILSPRLGMQVFVKSEKKSYVITSLKSKVIGGVDVPEAAVEAFEPVGAESITWNNDTVLSDMNDFVVAGVYDIKGERTRINDNLPILNTGGRHSFNARLTVLDSSITGTGENDDKCITQVLSFSNRLGQGEAYIRTGKGSSLDSLAWEKWSTLQRNVNVDEVVSLNHLVDNGIYSGVFKKGPMKTDYETFVMVVINDYALTGEDKRVSQFKYGLNIYGEPSYESRYSYIPEGYNSPTWTDWEILNKKEIDSMITDAVKDATKAFNSRIDSLIDGAPGTLDTLKEIADWVNTHEDLYETLSSIASTNATNIQNEVTRAKSAESGIAENALGIDVSGLQIEDGELQFVKKSLDNSKSGVDKVPAATTEKAGIMSAEDKIALNKAVEDIADNKQAFTTEIIKLKDGDTIVGQAREIHSKNGKNDSASFLVRTTAGSGTIGDGVATLKSVGGNIVKNIADFSKIKAYFSNSTIVKNNNFITATRTAEGTFGVMIPDINIVIPNHKYYTCVFMRGAAGNYSIVHGCANNIVTSSEGYNILTAISEYSTTQNLVFVAKDNSIIEFDVFGITHIDLTEMFGETIANSLTKEECDKLFGTMYALPQGLSIANPSVFKSTGWNQFNPDMVLVNKAIVDGAIVDGGKTLAIIPCLPCKIGEGENNGYHIHGDGVDGNTKVYLTPLNPMDVDGELYMHELALSEKGSYVPQIKGYMIVEVSTTANLCAHFLWSEDCDREAYEPYYEIVVELPRIPEMSEYGLAGIQSSGTLACDEIDFERGVYIKKIGAVDMGSLNWSWIVENGLFKSTDLSTIAKKPTYGSTPNLITSDYCIKKAVAADVEPVANHGMFFYTGGQLYLRNDDYTNAKDFKASLNEVMLYYELAEPIEYTLPKIDNNYISSDYGVEQFDGGVPCNANNLYYMRSLAGETRNFLDRLMAGLGTTDVTAVADRILAVVNPDVAPVIEEEIEQ